MFHNRQQNESNDKSLSVVVDPELELRECRGCFLLALLAFLPSIISFLPKIRGGGGGAFQAPIPDLPLVCYNV